MLEAGIPDDAFKAVTGDDKATASAVRRRNKQEAAGQLTTASAGDQDAFDQAVQRWQAQLAAPEDTPAQVRAKRTAYAALQQQEQDLRLACHLWTAAFFTPLTPVNDAAGLIPTSAASQQVRSQPAAKLPQLAGKVQEIALRNQFFHWPLEFPHIFAGPSTNPSASSGQGSGHGFDVMLGNPPWERIKLQEQEFFAALDPEIAGAHNKAARQKLIETLPQRTLALVAAFADAKYMARSAESLCTWGRTFPAVGSG